jgi:hypothetical protein
MNKLFFILFLLIMPASLYAVQCGNGVREGIEECDNGNNNSDTQPDVCRTDCRLPYCGDGVPDSNEECDDGRDYLAGNNDKIPGACRTDCKRAHCGDGVLDNTLGEQCDDDQFGCTDCFRCVKPQDDIAINRGYDGHYVKLCDGNYTINDAANNGVILITGSGLIIDCTGATIQSMGLEKIQPTSPNINLKQKLEKKKNKLRNIFPLSFNLISKAHADPMSISGKGIGFVVTGHNNTLINCRAEKFSKAIDLRGNKNIIVNH